MCDGPQIGTQDVRKNTREAGNSSVGLGMKVVPEFGAGHRDLEVHPAQAWVQELFLMTFRDNTLMACRSHEFNFFHCRLKTP